MITGNDVKRYQDVSRWKTSSNHIIKSIDYDRFKKAFNIHIEGTLMELASIHHDDNFIMTHEDYGSFRPIKPETFSVTATGEYIVVIDPSEADITISNNDMEFAPIEGFDDYFVKRDGTIWSSKRSSLHEMKLHTCRNNSVVCGLRNTPGGGITNILVGRTVAKAFLPNPENKKYIIHIDHDTTNNNVSNLMWSDSFESYITNKNINRIYPQIIAIGINDKSKTIVFDNINQASNFIISHNNKYKNSTNANYIRKAINNHSEFCGYTWDKLPLICQYDKNGKYIKSYRSFNDIFRNSNLKNSMAIKLCCEGKADLAHDYQWRYYDMTIGENDILPIIQKRIANNPFIRRNSC